MKTVKFTEMKKGSKEDYELLAEYEKNYVNELPDRILESLKNLDNSVDGYQVTRLEHSLQSATRAEKDGACLLYTSPSPRDLSTSRMPSSA